MELIETIFLDTRLYITKNFILCDTTHFGIAIVEVYYLVGNFQQPLFANCFRRPVAFLLGTAVYPGCLFPAGLVPAHSLSNR